MTQADNTFLPALKKLVGTRAVISDRKKTQHYCKGFRSGGGQVEVVVLPKTLRQLWEVAKLCVAYDKAIIVQAANTSLTGGSVPDGDHYDRDLILINTLLLNTIMVLDEGKQVLSFPGATLYDLEARLKPYDRLPHSVIGSSCLGASIVGGIANNSGGALVKRGPAYTELSLYAKVNQAGELEMVNQLGIDGLGETPEEILATLDGGAMDKAGYTMATGCASDTEYIERLKAVNADTPARYNANPDRLYGASGCAGKVIIFAVRLDTFPQPQKEQVFYLATQDAKLLAKVRRDMLTGFNCLPDSVEYMNRECFALAEHYGKDSYLIIKYLGTRWMPRLFAIKHNLDRYLAGVFGLPESFSDEVLQCLANLWPSHLPAILKSIGHKYQHQLLIKASDEGIAEIRSYLEKIVPSSSVESSTSYYLACTPEQGEAAFLHRFVAAGAMIRYQILNRSKVGALLSLDVALRRNDQAWDHPLPAPVADTIDRSSTYGHFLCHVFHRDYVLKQGQDANEVKRHLLSDLDKKGAKYPAEHNVGHLYCAEDSLAKFYQSMDPTNSFNPGIGKMNKNRNYADSNNSQVGRQVDC